MKDEQSTQERTAVADEVVQLIQELVRTTGDRHMLARAYTAFCQGFSADPLFHAAHSVARRVLTAPGGHDCETHTMLILTEDEALLVREALSAHSSMHRSSGALEAEAHAALLSFDRGVKRCTSTPSSQSSSSAASEPTETDGSVSPGSTSSVSASEETPTLPGDDADGDDMLLGGAAAIVRSVVDRVDQAGGPAEHSWLMLAVAADTSERALLYTVGCGVLPKEPMAADYAAARKRLGRLLATSRQHHDDATTAMDEALGQERLRS